MKFRHGMGLVLMTVIFSGCAIFGPHVPPGTVVLPSGVTQADWVPPPAQQTYFKKQSILFAEFGSIFYKRTDFVSARKYYDLAVTYDKDNPKALFGLAVIDWDEGKFENATKHFSSIKPVEKPMNPYDIDYHAAAAMFLGSLPVTGKVVALSRTDWINTAENVVVINKGSVNGLQLGMGFNIYRTGNTIRDSVTLEPIGTQKTLISHAVVVDMADRTAVCKVEKVEPNYFIQINDGVESDFGGAK